VIFHGLAEIGNYAYTKGSGRSQKSYDMGYVRFKLTRRLPHLVLDAKSNNFLNFTNLSDTFKGTQKVSLEGDFNNYYTLYAPLHYNLDVRYIFTPDVMAALIDHGGDLDLEIVDDEVYIYQSEHFDLESPDTYESLLHIVEVFGAELRDQSANYADDRVGHRTANLVAEPGRRLKPGWNWLLLAPLGMILLGFVQGYGSKYAPVYLWTGIFILTIVIILANSLWHRRRK
jgi:hypothetical protein